jgi:hypothetical protein
MYMRKCVCANDANPFRQASSTFQPSNHKIQKFIKKFILKDFSMRSFLGLYPASKFDLTPISEDHNKSASVAQLVKRHLSAHKVEGSTPSCVELI